VDVGRRTKIIVTIGPATRSLDRMRELIRAGADVFRLNFAHGTRGEHAEVIEMARRAAATGGKEVGLLGDLPGPKLRIGEVEDGMVHLRAGDELRLTAAAVVGNGGRLPMSWAGLPAAVSSGDKVFLADGKIRLQVLGTIDEEVHCRVEAGGPIGSHQGVNVPEAEFNLAAAGDEDLGWVDFAVEHGIDLLAVSFVSGPEDLAWVERRIDAHGAAIPLIAKIEKPRAAERAEEIVKAATAGIMVARGDLGIELPLECVPTLQKRLLALAGHHSKPSITATQMLASMVSSPRPTRAEVSDVANAIYQGTDAVMLSEETAIGAYPVEAVRVMDRIARVSEPDLPYRDWAHRRAASDPSDIASSVARAAVISTYTLGLAAIVVPTQSGRTARLVSAHRPSVPVLAISPRIETARRLQGLFGVSAILHDEPRGLRALLDNCAALAHRVGVADSGDLIAVIAGLPSQRLGTNLFEIHRVPAQHGGRRR
jgi:pyruvate kinase